MELQKALTVADSIIASLSPHCDIINLGGSCRRMKSEVKDIEIICLPKTRTIKDVFGEDLRQVRKKDFIATVEGLGIRKKGSPLNGKYVCIELKQEPMLDLFLPDADDYFRQLAIRTGPHEYSHKVLARGWRKKGWCGSDVGLRRIIDCIEYRPGTWKCVNPEAELPPAWKSEEEFLHWINVRYVHPSLRSVR
jgi:DNA polymerase/3'-5' exonuclease PolX